MRETPDRGRHQRGVLAGNGRVHRRAADGQRLFRPTSDPGEPIVRTEGCPTLVQGNAVKPGLERPRRVVLAALGPDGKEHFLKKLLATMAIAHHAADERQQGTGVPPDEKLQVLAVPLRHIRH